MKDEPFCKFCNKTNFVYKCNGVYGDIFLKINGKRCILFYCLTCGKFTPIEENLIQETIIKERSK